jgi:DNA-binding transcriptional regulator WhiA
VFITLEFSDRLATNGRVPELVDGHDSKSCGFAAVRVRFPLRPLMKKQEKMALAYIIGVALGDGNLSSPNGRATRLRVTCDVAYPNIAEEIVSKLSLLFPKNKVSIVPGPRDTYFNISVYSNRLNDLIPWKVKSGSKMLQSAHVPSWILENSSYSKAALRGLIHTDGSIYRDRGYLMLNFTNIIEPLVHDVFFMMQSLGFNPRISKTLQKSGTIKYTVRLARNVEKFIHTIGIEKTKVPQL